MADAIWLPEPDWSEGVTETLEWLTRIYESPTASEQRVAVRLSPRRTFEFKIMLDGVDRQRWENRLAGNGSGVWLMPVFPDVAVLATAIGAGDTTIYLDTAGRDFQPGSAVLLRHGDAVDAVEIADVAADVIELAEPPSQSWPAGTRLWPARRAVLTDPPAISRITDDVINARVRLRINESNPAPENAGALALYRGQPVLTVSSDWSQDVSAEYQRLQQLLDNSTGIPLITDTAGRTFVAEAHAWVQIGRDGQRRLRELLFWLRGRQRVLWVPGKSADLTPLAVAGNVLDVVATDYELQLGRRDIQIRLHDGQTLYRRITGVTVDGDAERLALDGDELDVNAGAIKSISFMRLCRLNSDAVSWQHVTDADGLATIDIVFREVRDELE